MRRLWVVLVVAGCGASEAVVVDEGAAVEGVAEPLTWAGAAMDGEIAVDPSGQLVVDAGLRRRFDWALAALGERTLMGVRQSVRRSVPPSQVPRVLELFDLYVAYLAEVDRLQLSGTATPAEAAAALAELRARMLPAEVITGFFTDEEGYLGKPSPDRVMASLLAVESTEAETTSLELMGAGEAQRLELRRQRVGLEVARRLANLDRSRAAWKAKVSRYREARSSAPDAGEGMLRERFTPAEQRRLRALELAGAL